MDSEPASRPHDGFQDGSVRATGTARSAYRWLAAINIVIILVYWRIHLAADPEAVDPLALRLVAAGLNVLVFVASYTADRGTLVRIVNGAYYLITLWLIGLVAVNQFAHEYAMGFLVVTAAIAMAMDSRRALVVYLSVTFSSLLVLASLVAEPRNGLLVFLAYALVLCVLVVMVTEIRLRIIEALRQSRERYALAAVGANDGLWEWDPVSNRVRYSSRWAEILGHSPEDVGTSPAEWLDRIHQEDRARVQAALAPVLNGQDTHFAVEHRMLHRDGSYRWVLTRGAARRDDTGRVVRMAGSQSDVTARKEAEERLSHEAFHDRLTGLPNRALLEDRIRQLARQGARRPELTGAVLLIDIDRFKAVNESLGHGDADQVLRTVARRIQDCLRAEDTLARYTGDEFAVLLPGSAEPEDAARVARRVQRAIQQPISVGAQVLHLTASVGIAVATRDRPDPAVLLRDANIAVNRAKLEGRGVIRLFDAAMHDEAVRALRLETELRLALAREEFVLHYQPIVSLESGRIQGVEALVRWRHPRTGLLLPESFVMAAEESGLIVPIGRWIVEEACRAMAAWRRFFPSDEPGVMSVNLSARQFADADVVSVVTSALDSSGLPPHHLCIEVTETFIMGDPEAARRTLTTLRNLGVMLALDDFGTGYSSLSHLHRLPVDTLKIDRSFVTRIGTDHRDTELVRSIVQLASNLRLHAVAEGVEETHQLTALRTMGCPFAQGYLLSPPLAARDCADMLANAPQLAPA